MPRLKKTECDKFLECIGKNVRICKEIFGIEKVSAVMGVSVNTVHNRIKNPSGINAKEIFRLAEYIGVKLKNFMRPLKLGKGGVK